MSEEPKLLYVKGCYMCWWNKWGKCTHGLMSGEVCPIVGFVSGCKLPLVDDVYECVKTRKYFEDNDW